jgi:hypothetical protein
MNHAAGFATRYPFYRVLLRLRFLRMSCTRFY